MKRVLLDTNAYSLVIKGNDKLSDYLDGMDQVFISYIVLGELYFGFRKGRRKEANEVDLKEFLEDFEVQIVGIDQEVSRIYGEIAYQLEKAGTPIPTNDMWIAAQAMWMDAELITFDGHFKAVKGLRVWKG